MFSVYGTLGRVRNACTHYRIYTPLMGLKIVGAAAPIIEELQEVRDEQMFGANFHLYYLRGSRGLLRQIHAFNRDRQSHDLNRRRHAPHVIYDADDHVERISIWNPRYVSLGTHTPDGHKMERGDRILTQYDNEPEPIELWKDGDRYMGGDVFDVMANRSKMNILKLTARACSGVTCSTEYLSEVYRSYGCKNVFTFPNSLLDEDYPDIHPRRPKNVTILWQGGHAHYEDWLTIIDPLRSALEKRPNARFLMWGPLFPAVRRAVPEAQFEHLSWMPYEKYTLRLATLGHHINLCPIVDDPFNNAKSSIKWMESSAITHPAATLAANVGPYGRDIKHGETGLLYNSEEEFEQYLLDLIDDAALRHRLAYRAHQYVWDNFHVVRTAPKLAEWYRQILFRSMV